MNKYDDHNLRFYHEGDYIRICHNKIIPDLQGWEDPHLGGYYLTIGDFLEIAGHALIMASGVEVPAHYYDEVTPPQDK